MPGKARRAYHWEPKHPRGPKPTMYHRVSVNLGTRPRRLGHSIDGGNVNTKGEKEAAKGKEQTEKEAKGSAMPAEVTVTSPGSAQIPKAKAVIGFNCVETRID